MTSTTAPLRPEFRRSDPDLRARRSGARPRSRGWSCELGTEPPLDPASPGPGADRRDWSIRWFGGSVLTGCAGALLLGSAIYVSSDGDLTFAEPAEPAPALSPRAADGSGPAARKGDKLVRAEMAASAKQVFRSPMTLRAGDREVIKVRSFVRIATNLSMVSGVYATDIPPFNPLRFFSEGPVDRAAELPPETSDADVSVVKSDLSLLAVEFGASVLTDADVAEQIQEEARMRAEAGRRGGLAFSSLPLPQSLMLPRSRTLDPGLLAPSDPGGMESAFRTIDVRVVPENVSTLDKGVPAASATAFTERSLTIRRGDTLEGVLAANGAAPDDARAVVAALGGRDKALPTLEGLLFRLLFAPGPNPGEPGRIARATLLSERGIEAIAAMTDRGVFVPVAPPPIESGKADTKANAEDGDDEAEAGGVTLYNSLYETALKQDLPRYLVEDLIRVFGYDVDFQRRVTPGDSFELFYATDEEGSAERPEVLSAALTIGSEVHRVFRYQGEDGSVDFFDEAGRSLKKFLLRKPVLEARLSSGYGNRFHPILGYAKMHTGVDWAARVGTPILTAGIGTVIKAGWDSGYGRRVEVQHANGYVTTYNHLSAFGRGVAPGARLRQGQILGYVGSSGLSTGAHLHYEVVVNGHFVDPMRIRVPRGRELDGRALVDFSRQRDQVSTLMQKATNPNRLAQRDSR